MSGGDVRAGRWAMNGALLLVIVAFGAPFAVSIVSAFDGGSSGWTLDHFRALGDLGVGAATRNSLIVAGLTMLLAVPTASAAGYGLSRVRLRRKATIAYGVLLLQAIPLAATMVPIYDLTRRLHLENTYRGLVLTHLAISLPLLVWLMKQAHDAVPVDAEEAAWCDGASGLRAWRDVVLPQTGAGLAVVAGLSFATAWSEVLMVAILIDQLGKETLPFLYFLAADQGGGGVTAALGILYVTPVLLVFLALWRTTNRVIERR